MKRVRKKNEAGFTLLELLVILVVLGIIATIAIIGSAPALTSLDIDQVTSQTIVSIETARREALSGNSNTSACTFDITRSLGNNHPGILLATQSPGGANKCQNGCGTGQQLLCVSGEPFCYSINNRFTFERSSGRLTQGQAIFIISRSRKLAVLVSSEGGVDVAELVDGQWPSRTELQRW